MEESDGPRDVIVEWRGHRLTVPPPERWAFRMQVFLRRDDIAGAVESIIGPAQVDELVASDLDLSADDIRDLIETIGAAVSPES